MPLGAFENEALTAKKNDIAEDSNGINRATQAVKHAKIGL